VATGVKRAQPDKFVFTYQGDGDLAAIGTSEIVHAANRGENLSVIFVNNTTYGMTGGQMAPTTMLGQKTSTTPYGRDFRGDGYPIRMAELLAGLEGTAYSARVAVSTPAQIRRAKESVRKAFEMQLGGMGLSIVEFLSTCPTNWGMKPLDAQKRVLGEMSEYFPLGVFKERKQADFA
jgi:2-oxoglutarate ferredoxin oxidoreductase subunit beta